MKTESESSDGRLGRSKEFRRIGAKSDVNTPVQALAPISFFEIFNATIFKDVVCGRYNSIGIVSNQKRKKHEC